MMQKNLIFIFFSFLALTSFGQTSDLKSQNATKFRLDSIVSQEWDSYNNRWIPGKRDIYEYNDSNSLLSFKYYYYDLFSDKTILGDKDEFVYDSNNRKIEYTSYNQTQIDFGLIPGSKKEYLYGDNNLVSSEFFYGWKSNLNQWPELPSAKYEYTYNNDGNIIICNTYGRDGNSGEWVSSRKEEYSYNNYGKLIEYVSYYVNKNTNEWSVIGENKYLYDSEGNKIEYISYSLNESIGQLIYNQKQEYLFNGDTMQTNYFTWNITEEKWNDAGMSKIIYDNGNVVKLLNYITIDENTGEYIPSEEIIYDYDLTSDISNLILPPLDYVLYRRFNLFRYGIKNKPISYQSMAWKWDTNEWIPKDSGLFYYSEYTVNSISELNKENIVVFPNPVEDNLYFKIPGSIESFNFQLYDNLGHKIIDREVRNSDILKIDNLESGLYIYTIIGFNGDRQNGKLIKK